MDRCIRVFQFGVCFVIAPLLSYPSSPHTTSIRSASPRRALVVPLAIPFQPQIESFTCPIRIINALLLFYKVQFDFLCVRCGTTVVVFFFISFVSHKNEFLNTVRCTWLQHGNNSIIIEIVPKCQYLTQALNIYWLNVFNFSVHFKKPQFKWLSSPRARCSALSAQCFFHSRSHNKSSRFEPAIAFECMQWTEVCTLSNFRILIRFSCIIQHHHRPLLHYLRATLPLQFPQKGIENLYAKTLTAATNKWNKKKTSVSYE